MRVTITQRPTHEVNGEAVATVVVGASRRRPPKLSSVAALLRRDAHKHIASGEDAVSWFDAHGARVARVLLVSVHEPARSGGLGGEGGSFGELDAQMARQTRARSVGAIIERSCRAAGVKRLVLADLPPWMPPELVVEGIILSAHRTRDWQTVASRERLRSVTIVSDDPDLASRLRIVEISARCTNEARTLADMPSNVGDPNGFATAITDRAESAGLGTREITAEEARSLGMGLFSAVAAGGSGDGRIVVLEHYPAVDDPDGGELLDGDEREPPLLGLVGKGVTHDLGGYNLKPGSRLAAMTYDKAGAAAVAGAMLAIAELDLPIHVIAVLPIAENALDRPAYKPGDVLEAMDGTTVFVDNADAEGRLMMADAMCWLAQFEPRFVVDLATLTGAASVALGEPFAGLYANDDAARELVRAAGDRAGDRVWPMPIHDLHDREIGHYKADLRNANSTHRMGTASIAAAFLRQFVDTPWAHIDMGGKAAWESPRDVLGVGATGFGTRLLIEVARDFADRFATHEG